MERLQSLRVLIFSLEGAGCEGRRVIITTF
jgi:hypothetical protein